MLLGRIVCAVAYLGAGRRIIAVDRRKTNSPVQTALEPSSRAYKRIGKRQNDIEDDSPLMAVSDRTRCLELVCGSELALVPIFIVIVVTRSTS